MEKRIQRRATMDITQEQQRQRRQEVEAKTSKRYRKFGKSESLRKAALSLLKAMVAKTDNDVDDAIVKMIEEKLFPVK